MKLSIVIPAYNEETTITKVVEEITRVMSTQKTNYELIVVDDGSKDNTSKVVTTLIEKSGRKNKIKIIKHIYNKGYGASLKTGAKNAKGKYVMYIDADGQHDPRYIPKLLKHIDRYDMVIGARKGIYSTSLFRAPGKKILSMVANYLAEKKIPDLNSGFRIIKKTRIYEFMSILPNAFSFTTTITLACIKSCYDLKYVQIKMRYRKGGKSVLNPFKDGPKFIMLLLRITMLFSPLKVFLPASFFLFLLGIIHMGIGVVIFFKVPSLSVILILSSIMVFFFGLLADQIATMRMEQRV